MVRTLTFGGRDTVPTEVMNPTAEEVYLCKGTLAAVALPVLEVADETTLSETYQRASSVERQGTEEASKALLDSVEEMAQEAMYPMT